MVTLNIPYGRGHMELSVPQERIRAVLEPAADAPRGG